MNTYPHIIDLQLIYSPRITIWLFLFSFLLPSFAAAQNGGPCDPLILNFSKKVNNFSAENHNYDLGCGDEFNESIVFFKYVAPFDIDSLNVRLTKADPSTFFDSMAVAFYKDFDCNQQNIPQALHCTKQFSKGFVHEYFDLEKGESIVFALGAASGHQGEFRVNIYRNLEMADSCQDIHSGSKLDFEIYWPDFSGEPYICQESTLEYAQPDSLFDGYDFSQSPTVWLKMDYSGEDYKTQIFSTVESYGSWKPVWSLYYGSCDSLINAGNFDNTNSLTGYGDSTILWTAIESYSDPHLFVAVTADPNGPPIDDPGFRLCGVPIINAKACLGPDEDCCGLDYTTEILIIDREYSDLEPDYDPEEGYSGPFLPGEEVTVHIEFFYDATETENDKLYGFVPDFGLGWDLESVDFEKDHPNGLDNVSWHEYGSECSAVMRESVPHLCTYEDIEGTLRLCNAMMYFCACDEIGMYQGQKLPNSYFWKKEGEGASCDHSSCIPGYHESQALQTTQFNWDFEIKVEDFDSYDEKVLKQDLTIGFQTLSQGTAGCWEDALGKCLIDKFQKGPSWRVDITSQSNHLLINDDFQCNPNPFNDELEISFNNTLESKVEISVYDSFGRKVLHHVDRFNQDISISTQNWLDGIYFLEMRMEGKVFREKLVKQSP